MKRSKHNLSHTQLHGCRMGELVPIGLTEVLPGDTFQHASQVLIRCAPLMTPPLHPVRIDVRHFFVPNRLIWDDWEDFITGGPDGTDASEFPTMNSAPILGSTLDHLGVPPGTTTPYSALPLRAVIKIWNEFYRDQDLQSEHPLSTASGPDSTTFVDPLFVSWEKDYFTTARPFEQKGPDVTLPLGTSATGTTRITTGGPNDGTQFQLVRGEADSSGQATVDMLTGTMTVGTDLVLRGTTNVDLTTATAATVNQLRLALALQRYQEARARYGSRYTEYLRYLGVRSSDARLQRPEYLGGARTSVQFSEVLSTSAAEDTGGELSNVPGNFGGHGIGANRSNRYRRFFEEHGFVISLLSVIPQTMYPNGLFRHWNRRTKEDFFQRELQHIGQQAILNKEVHSQHVTPNGVFGYQDRYDEYRRSESQVHGRFRFGENLQDWHFARNYANTVALNDDFVRAQPSVLPFQVQSGVDTLLVAARHQLIARRLVAAKGSSFIL